MTLNAAFRTRDGEVGAYQARPRGSAKAGLLIIQEIFGVNANIRSIADGFARQGYHAVAPDLFWRISRGTDLDPASESARSQAMSLAGQVDDDQALEDLGAVAAELRTRHGKVGAVGYCLGGRFSFLLWLRSKVDVGVSYYGVGLQKYVAETNAPAGDLVLHLAGQDHLCPPDVRAQISARLVGLPNATLYVYPNAGHAFAREGGEHFDPAAAALAHERTGAALSKALG